MADTYLSSSIVGFDHQDTLDTRVDTYSRLSPILNAQDNPAVGPNIMKNLSILQTGISRVADAPKIDLGSALVSDDPNIKALAQRSLSEMSRGDLQYRFDLGRSIESPVGPESKKFFDKEFGYSAIRDNEDFYYQNDYMKDGWLMRNLVKNPLRFVGRVVPQAALKLGQGIGFLGSMVTSIGSDNYWADVADNGFSRWLTEVEQDYKDQIIPVYKQAGFDEKGFFTKLVDWSFWNDSVADAVAFMGSAAIPGLGLSRIGGAFGAGFGAAARAGSIGARTGNLLGRAGLGSWAEITSFALNTGMEAAQEGAGVFKSVKEKLEYERSQGLNNLSDDEIRERSGKMAANTIGGNFAVLALSNAWENKLFFKSKKSVDGRASIDLGSDLTASSRALTQLDKKGLAGNISGLSRTGFYGKKAVGGIFMEGLWEENAQLAIQRMNEEDDSRTDDTVIGRFGSQLLKQTMGAFAGEDQEAAESIGLGALIGIGAGTVFSKVANERRKLINNTRDVVKYANEAKNNLFSTIDIYKRDDQGNIVYDANNNPEVDPAKYAAKEKAYQDVFGKLMQGTKDEYLQSKPMQFETKKALASYVRSLNNIGITDVSSRFSNLDTKTAEAFGITDAKINENLGDLAQFAESFERISSAVNTVKVGEKPADLTPAQFDSLDKARKSKLYDLYTENEIINSFITEDTSKQLEALNKFRNLSNASLQDFPVDQINSLIQQRKLNKQIIDDPSFSKMSETEQEYHNLRDKQLEEEIDNYKRTNSILAEAEMTPSGYYKPSGLDPFGNKTTYQFDPQSTQLQMNVSSYKNTLAKNNYFIDKFSGKEWSVEYQKYSETEFIKKLIEAAAKENAKYRERNEGDFNKVLSLANKLAFVENPELSQEEQQLQTNYQDLLNDILSEYTATLEQNRLNLLTDKLNSVKKVQESIRVFIETKEEALGEKKVELEILREELEMAANGKKADQKRLNKTIKQLEKDITTVSDRLDKERENLEKANQQIAELEAEISEGNFTKMTGALNEVKEQIKDNEARLQDNITLLDKVKKILKDAVKIFNQLFPNTNIKLLDRVFGDEIYGQQNRAAYEPEVVQSYEEIEASRGRKAAIEQTISDINNTLAELRDKFNTNNNLIERIYLDTNKYFRDKYLDLTKEKPKPIDPEEQAVSDTLMDDENFPPGNNSGGKGFETEEGFDGNSYQRPLHTKFYTTTFPYIGQDGDIKSLDSAPQDVKDYFEFLDQLTDPNKGKELNQKLGKGKLKALIVTRNNVDKLKLTKALADRAEYFKNEEAAFTHFEVIPVLEEGGFLYYIDKNFKKLGKVGEEISSKTMLRRSLRTVKYTPAEEEAYLKKYTQDDLDKARKIATTWRETMLVKTGSEDATTFDFTVSRGIANKMVMQDGTYAKNPVIGNLIDEKLVTGQTVRVYSEDTASPIVNGLTITVPAGRPFIYTNNSKYEQLHAADNNKLEADQVVLVKRVIQEMLMDHIKKIEEALYKSSDPIVKELAEKVKTAGGIKNVDYETKRSAIFAITKANKNQESKVKLLNSNYTRFLSSIVYFGPTKDRNGKRKDPGSNQIYFSGTKLFFGPSISIDITQADQLLSNAEIDGFLNNQYHNIKYFTSTEKANKEFFEYYLENDKLAVRTWPNYAQYLLSETTPDGKKRDFIPVTTALKTEEQIKLDKNGNPYKYESRALVLKVDDNNVASKKVKKKVKEEEEFDTPNATTASEWLDLFTEIDPSLTTPKQKETKKTEKKPTPKPVAKKVEPVEEEEEVEEQEPETDIDQAAANIIKALQSGFQTAADESMGRTPEEDTPSTDFGESMFRISKGGVFKTEEDLDAVIADVQRMLPQFPVVRLKKAIMTSEGLEAWGQFVNNTIEVFEGAEKGTSYHEAFEAVANKILSDAEWNAMSKEFRQRSGYFTDRETDQRLKYSEATDQQIKEQLAEEFIDYKNGKQPEQKQTRSFFKIIWDFIKALFNGRSAIQDIFAKIDQGKFAKAPLRTENRFNRNYRLSTLLPVDVRRDLFHGATAYMFQQLFYTPQSLSYLDEIMENDISIYEPVREKFQERKGMLSSALKAEKDEKQKERYEKGIKAIDIALNNWKDFVQEHKNSLKPLRIKFMQNDMEISEEQQELKNRNDYAADIFKVDAKKSASRSIRFLFGTLLNLTFDQGKVTTINGKQAGMVKTIPNSVFMPSLAGYDAYILRALDELQGLNDFTLIEQKLRDLSSITQIEEIKNPDEQARYISQLPNEKAIWTSLYMRVFGASNKVSEEASYNLKVKLHNYVSKHSPTPYYLVNGGGTSAVVESVGRQGYENILRKINSSIVSNQALVFTKKLKNNVTSFVPIPEFTKKIASDEFTVMKIAKFIEFLGLADILTPDFLKKMSIDERNEIKAKLLLIRNALTETDTPNITIRNLNIFGYTDSLIRLIDKKLQVEIKESQFFNINNEPQQKHVIPSFISRLFSALNTVSNRAEFEAKYPQVATTFAQDSILMSKLFDEEGNRTSFTISLGYMEGIKDLDEQEGTKTAKLEFSDKYWLQFNSSLTGKYFSLPADSETEWIFDFGEFVPFSENILSTRGRDIVNKLFFPKLLSEMYAAKESSNLIQMNKKHPSSGRKIGNSLRFFKDILGKDLVNDIMSELDKDTMPEKILGMDTKKKGDKASIKERVVQAVIAHLNKEVDKTLNTLVDNNLVLERKYQDKNIPSDFLVTGLDAKFVEKNSDAFSVDESGMIKMNLDSFRSLLEYHKLNTIIANMEAFKLVYGDPAQYKDWEKRAKSLFGPIEQIYYDQTGEFNNWLNANKNSAVLGDEMVELPQDDIFRTEFSDQANSRTVADITVTNVETVNDLVDLNSEFANRFISQYEETNEADGQSVGTLAFARHLLIKSGWRWTKEHEAFYQYDTALMRKELSERGIYKYKDQKLKDLDKKIVDFYKENPPNVLLSPLKTLMPFVDKEGNQHLFKHSVYFLSYQAAKQFNGLDLYIDMLNRRDSLLNFESVQKIGLKGDKEGKVTSFYKDPFTKNDLIEMGNPVEVIDLRTVGIQVETQGSSKGQTLGTQLTKLINLNMSQAGVPVDFIPEEGLSDSQILEIWNNLTEEEKLQVSPKYNMMYGPRGVVTTLENLKVKNSLNKLSQLGVRWKISDDGQISYEISDLTKIKDYIEEELRRLEVDENTINTIQLTEDLKAFRNPAESVPSYTTITNLLWSLADSSTAKMKVNGKSYIQVASTFFNKSRKAAYKEDGKWIVVDNKADYDRLVSEGKKMVMTSSDLKFYTKNKETGEVEPMEILLPHIYLEKVNKHRKALGKEEFTEGQLLEYLNKNPKLLEGIGFRIPTQATSSIEMFKIKGFLPKEFGSAVVVPSGITTKAGSDFDVDKLNTYLNNWLLKNGLPVYEEFLDDTNSTVEERYFAFVKDNVAKFSAISKEMKERMDYFGRNPQDIIDENLEEIDDARSELNAANSVAESVYNEGLNIFRKLNPAIKQQFYERERELNNLNIEGEEKVIDYISYTQAWIDQMRGAGAIRLPYTDKQGKTTEVTVNTADQISIMQDMIDNYKEFLKLNGIAEETYKEFIEKKAHNLDENSDIRYRVRKAIIQNVAANNMLPTMEEFAKLPLFLQNKKGAVENEYFQAIRNILKQPEMFEYLLSPNSIDHIKNNRDIVMKAMDPKWEPESKREINYSEFLSSEYLTKKRNDFTKGKYDIGIFAVAMTNFANSQITGIGVAAEGGLKEIDSFVFDEVNNGNIELPFRDIKVMRVNDIFFIPISSLKDADGNLTMDKLSSYINGAVDVAKEPLIVEMGMHSELAGVYTLLERMGLTGRTTALFLYQPAIRRWLKEYLMFDSKTYFSKSNYAKYKDLIKDLIGEYNPDSLGYDPSFKFTDEMLENLIRKGELVKKGKASFTREENYAQFMALANFLKVKMLSNHLLENIQASNHDTSSIRSPYVLIKKDLQVRRSKMGNMVVKVDKGNIINGSEVLRNGTAVKTDVKMLNMFNELLSDIGLFALQKENPKAALVNIAARIFNQNPFITNDNFISVMREYESAMIDSLVVNTKIPSVNLNGETIYNELYRYAKQYFVTESKTSLKKRFDKLKKMYPQTVKKNAFLSNLEIETNPVLGIDVMRLKKKPSNSDVLEKERITEGMMQLANYDETKWPEIVQFYRAAVYGAYLQFGIKFSRSSFVDLIPVAESADETMLTITDLTTPALENIDSEDFSTFDELVQRSRWYKKDLLRKNTHYSLHMLKAMPGGKFEIEKQARWRSGKSKPPSKQSQTFFANLNEKGEIVPNIQPAFIWGGYASEPRKWTQMEDIISIPAVRPEYIIATTDDMGRTTYKVNPVVKKMSKRRDYSYLYEQLYKKVGVENPHLGRGIVTGKGDKKSVLYLYKPINKYGSREFPGEMVPLEKNDSGSISGKRGIIKEPVFKEIPDEELIASIEDKTNMMISPLKPEISEGTRNAPVMKPVSKKNVPINMSAENVRKIERGVKTTTIRSQKEANDIGIPAGKTEVRIIGDKKYLVTNRGMLTIAQAGGKAVMLASEGVKKVEDLMFRQSKEWMEGKGKLYVYDIKKMEDNPPPVEPEC